MYLVYFRHATYIDVIPRGAASVLMVSRASTTLLLGTTKDTGFVHLWLQTQHTASFSYKNGIASVPLHADGKFPSTPATFLDDVLKKTVAGYFKTELYVGR